MTCTAGPSEGNCGEQITNPLGVGVREGRKRMLAIVAGILVLH
jgi:hypothetical protein